MEVVMKQLNDITHKDIAEIFSTDKSVNVFLRIGAIIVTIACLILFTESFHKVLNTPWEEGGALRNLFNSLLALYLFWPMSHVAIKGKGPKKWIPY
jgi:hypothetical protein